MGYFDKIDFTDDAEQQSPRLMVPIVLNNGDPKILGTDGYLNTNVINDDPITVDYTKYMQTGFGDVKVVEPYTLNDSINKYCVCPKLYGSQTANDATITHDEAFSSAKLTVSNLSDSEATLRTHTYYRYQAGKQFIIKQAIIHEDIGQTNQIRTWGLNDGYDGVFWKLDGYQLAIVKRSSSSGTIENYTVLRDDWNYDKLDGSGKSRFTLDLLKCNVYEIHLNWFGAINFFINGFLVHEIKANCYVSSFIKSAVLPLSVNIKNTDSSISSSIYLVGISMFIAGGQDPYGITYGAFASTPKQVSHLTETPILSIRPKLTFNNITNRTELFPVKASISTVSKTIYYRIIMNAELTGASWQSVDGYSFAEYDVSASSFSGGQHLIFGFVDNVPGSNNDIDLKDFFNEQGSKLILDAFGTIPNTLSIVALSTSTAETTCRASLTWTEVR